MPPPTPPPHRPHTPTTRAARAARARGALLGSAVGDALGAPFEFSPEGCFTARFPLPLPAPAVAPDVPRGHMHAGGGWDEGEATDDTQMALHIAESLVSQGGLDLPDVFARFRRWAAADPKDIGLQTEAVLTSGDPWDLAAALHFQSNHHAAGNGALMRATPSALYFARQGRDATMAAARSLAALTHGDRAAWEGTALYHELIRLLLDGHDDTLAPEDPTLPALLAVLPRDEDRTRYAVVLSPDWHPSQATEFNGAVWPCLGTAVWAVRTTRTFPDALAAAIDCGGDTDTVAAVTGGLAGARYGLAAIPESWLSPLHVPLPGTTPARTYRTPDLIALADTLDTPTRP